VVGDRGVGTSANDQALEALGIKRVGLQRNGTPGRARLAVERARRFRRLRDWAGRDRGRISHLKGGFGLRRTRLRRLGAART
jgi:transposase, IS5 family